VTDNIDRRAAETGVPGFGREPVKKTACEKDRPANGFGPALWP